MKKRFALLALDGALLLGFMAIITQWNRLIALLPSCPINRYLGLYCTSCGGTRMVYYALHGDWLRSFFSNPFLFLLGIYLAVAIVLYHITCFTR